MGTLTSKEQLYQYQWASDVEFDGIRLEVLSDSGQILFDVSVPEAGAITVNTFSNDVPASLIADAASIAERRTKPPAA